MNVTTNPSINIPTYAANKTKQNEKSNNFRDVNPGDLQAVSKIHVKNSDEQTRSEGLSRHYKRMEQQETKLIDLKDTPQFIKKLKLLANTQKGNNVWHPLMVDDINLQYRYNNTSIHCTIDVKVVDSEKVFRVVNEIF